MSELSSNPSGPSALAPPAPPPRSRRALLWIGTSYFGEGLPWSFLHQISMQFLTAIRASNTQVSSTSLLHLAVTLKFLWSPLVDLFGRTRTWVVAMQIVIGCGMLAVAGIAAPDRLPQFWAALSILAVLHATHDIACDGFYLLALNRHDQALFSGVRSAAFRAAMWVGSSALVFLAAKKGWTIGFGACGVIMILVGVLNGVVMPRPPADRSAAERANASPGAEARAEKARAFWAAYRSFLTQPQAPLILSFMFLYRLGDIMMFAMSQPMLRDIGVDTAHRAVLSGFGYPAFLVASVLGGAIIARLGLRRCFIPMTYVQNLAILLYIAMAILKPRFEVVMGIVIVEQFASGIGNAAHVVFLMQRCRAAFSASHYAFASAIVALGSTLSGFFSGPINTAVGHPVFFTIAFLASVPCLILVWIVPKDPIEAIPASTPAA